MPLYNDTIFALSSGRPPAAIAVVRVSGPRARAALEGLMGRVPEARRATLAKLRNPSDGEVIDDALVLWFPAPHSETGEDVAELHLHGGRAVIAATFAALGELHGFRPAEAGEFTRRAFEHGRLDLTAVEGLADMIGAETEAQRRQALRQLQGFLGKRAEHWRARLIEALALVEAALDFSDEGDVPADVADPAKNIAAELRDEIAAALADGRRGERVREGLTVAIAGPPNAGKSSLFNALSRREAAIVSPYPGTTRDVLELHLDLNGYPVTLWDTAGVRASDDPIEQEGVRRAQARAAEADLVLWVTDASKAEPAAEPPQMTVPTWRILNKTDLLDRAPSAGATGKSVDALPPLVAGPDQVGGKLPVTVRSAGSDAGSPLRRGRAERGRDSKVGREEDAFAVSARTGDGLPDLLAEVARFAEQTLTGGEPALVTRERHRRLLEETCEALNQASNMHSPHLELLAEDLRVASRSLGKLTGKIDVEHVLDAIFRDFCIGK